MLEKTLKKLLSNYKLYTVAQFGLDTDLSSFFIDYFDNVSFFDNNSEYASKVESSLNCKNCGVIFTDNIQHDVAYLDFDYDFVYVHNRLDATDDHFLVNHFRSKKTKFILTHPKVSTMNVSGEYGVTGVQGTEGIYSLYYRKLILD